MVYIFDTSSFRVLNHYFPQRFPSFWINFDKYVSLGQIISVREVYNELVVQGIKPHLTSWINLNKAIFLTPDGNETKFITQIFAIPHFRNLVNQKQILQGRPAADPFVVAAAKVKNAFVVTEEKMAKNAAKIPNVCEYFKIDCINMERFMENEGWEF
jgi:hypothetical protein